MIKQSFLWTNFMKQPKKKPDNRQQTITNKIFCFADKNTSKAGGTIQISNSKTKCH